MRLYHPKKVTLHTVKGNFGFATHGDTEIFVHRNKAATVRLHPTKPDKLIVEEKDGEDLPPQGSEIWCCIDRNSKGLYAINWIRANEFEEVAKKAAAT